MENSIKEDIILLKDFTEGNFKRDKLENYKGSYKMGYFYYKDIQQAIEHILSDYKRVLKENKELKEEIGVDYTTVYLKGVYDEREKQQKEIKDKIEELKQKEESDFRSYGFAVEAHLALQVLQELLERKN